MAIAAKLVEVAVEFKIPKSEDPRGHFGLLLPPGNPLSADQQRSGWQQESYRKRTPPIHWPIARTIRTSRSKNPQQRQRRNGHAQASDSDSGSWCDGGGRYTRGCPRTAGLRSSRGFGRVRPPHL